MRQAVAFINQKLIRLRENVLFADNFAQLSYEAVVRFKLCGAGSHG